MLAGILKNNRSSVLLLFVTLILPVLGSLVSSFVFYEYEDQIKKISSIDWLVFYLITAFTMALALTPTTYIALVSGYFLGWISLVGLIPSYMFSALIAYYLAGKFDKGKLILQLKENERAKEIMENLKTDEFWVIFFCRISPAPPFAMMNVFLSFMKVEFKNFISASFLGMLPRTLFSVWIGYKASDLMTILRSKNAFSYSNLLALLLLIIAVGSLYLIIMRAIRKRNPN